MAAWVGLPRAAGTMVRSSRCTLSACSRCCSCTVKFWDHSNCSPRPSTCSEELGHFERAYLCKSHKKSNSLHCYETRCFLGAVAHFKTIETGAVCIACNLHQGTVVSSMPHVQQYEQQGVDFQHRLPCNQGSMALFSSDLDEAEGAPSSSPEHLW